MASTSTNRRSSRDDADEHISFLRPSTAVAGGLRNNFEGTIESARYEAWDFKGKAKPAKVGDRHLSGVKMALHLVVGELDDSDDPAATEDIWWPCGPIEDYVPADDGTSFEAVTGRKGFSRDSEVIQGIASMIECKAFGEDDIDIDPSPLEGFRFRWERKPPLWANRKERPEGSKTVDNLMPVKLISAPSAKSGGKGGGKASASTSSKSEKDVPQSDVADRCKDLVMEVLDDLPAKQDTISREELGSEVIALCLQKYKKGPDAIDKETRDAIGELFENDAFLDDNAGRKTWDYDVKSGEVTRR